MLTHLLTPACSTVCQAICQVRTIMPTKLATLCITCATFFECRREPPLNAYAWMPNGKKWNLQVVLEMIELRETETARVMLRTVKVFRRLQLEDPERFLRLDKLTQACARSMSTPTP